MIRKHSTTYNTYIYIYTNIYIYIYSYVHMYVDIYVYVYIYIYAKGFETEFRERINRPNPTNKKRLFKSPSPKGKAVPSAGTTNEPEQGAFNQKMNKPSKGRDNRKQAQSSKTSRQTIQRSKQSKPERDPTTPSPDPQPAGPPAGEPVVTFSTRSPRRRAREADAMARLGCRREKLEP